MATVRTLISCECMPSQMSPGLNGRRHQQQPQPSLHEYQISLELIFSMLKRKSQWSIESNTQNHVAGGIFSPPYSTHRV